MSFFHPTKIEAFLEITGAVVILAGLLGGAVALWKRFRRWYRPVSRPPAADEGGSGTELNQL